jgi:hypothetical protein
VAKSLVVRIIAEAGELSAGMKKATAETESFGSKMSKVAGLAGTAIVGAFAVEKVAEFVGEAVKGAESLQKSGEVITQTMGKSGDSVKKFGESTAAGFGISAQQSEAVSAKFGLLFRSMGVGQQEAAKMTIGWQELAGSLSQIKGVDPSAVMNAMTLAAQGSSRGLKQLGIDITTTMKNQEAANEGFGDSYSKLTAAQQSTVLYNLATKDLGQTMIEAKANSGDLSDQSRILSAEWSNAKDQLGTALLPMLSKVATFMADNLPAAIKAVKTGLQDLKPTITAIGDVLGALVGIVRDHWNTIKDIFAVIKAIITTDLKVMGDAIKLVAAILNGDWSEAWKDAKKLVNDAITGIKAILTAELTAIGNIAKGIGNAIKNGIEDGVSGIGAWLSSVWSGITSAIRGAVGSVLAAASSFGKAIYDGITSAISGLGDALVQMIIAPINRIIGLIDSISIPSFSLHIDTHLPGVGKVGFDYGGSGSIFNIPRLDTGGDVLETGLAIVHKGETVLPGGRARGDIIVNVAGSVIAERDLYQLLQRLSVLDVRSGGPGLVGA